MSISLRDLITAVQDRKLSKDQLEHYRDQMSELYALMSIELAEIEKSEAIFFSECEEPTDVAKKRKWAITKEGQRQIELKNYLKGTEKMLSSLKSRLYSMF